MKKKSAQKANKISNELSAQDLKKITDSLLETLQIMAFACYKAVENTGDYRHKGSGGYKGTYKTYWINEYQFVFFTAFYTLEAAIREISAIKKIAKDSNKLFNKFLADKKACQEAYKTPKFARDMIAEIRVFDGSKNRKPTPINFDEILKLAKTDGVLMGWLKGLPKHLAYLGGKPLVYFRKGR
jgi:hypothetical protein